MGNAQTSASSRKGNSATPVSKSTRKLRRSTQEDFEDEYEVEEVVEEVEVQEIQPSRSTYLPRQDSRISKSVTYGAKMSFGKPPESSSITLAQQLTKNLRDLPKPQKKKPADLYKIVGKAERFATSALALLQNDKVSAVLTQLNSSLKDPIYWNEYSPRMTSLETRLDHIPLPSELGTQGRSANFSQVGSNPSGFPGIEQRFSTTGLPPNPYRQQPETAHPPTMPFSQIPIDNHKAQSGNPFQQSIEDLRENQISRVQPSVLAASGRKDQIPGNHLEAKNLPVKIPLVNPIVQPQSNQNQFFQTQPQQQLKPASPASHLQNIQPVGQESPDYSQITSPYPEHPKYRIGKPTSQMLGTHQCQEDCEECHSELEQQERTTVRNHQSDQQVAEAKLQIYSDFLAQLQREELPNKNLENYQRLYSPSGSYDEDSTVPANTISGKLKSKGRDLLGDTSSQIVRTMERTLQNGIRTVEPAVVTQRGVKTIVTKTTTKDKHGNTLPHHIVKFVSETSGQKSRNLVYQIDEYQAKNYLSKPKNIPGGSGLSNGRPQNPASPRTVAVTKQGNDKPKLMRPEDFWPNPKKFGSKEPPRFELTELQRLSVEAESMRHSLSYVTPKYEPGNLNFNLETIQGTRRSEWDGSARKTYGSVDETSRLETPKQQKGRGNSGYYNHRDPQGSMPGRRPGLMLSEMTPEQIDRKVADSLRDFKFD